MRVRLLWRKVQLDEHVDGGNHGTDVMERNDVRVAARPQVCQVKDLKRKLAGVRRKGRGNDEIRQETSVCWPTLKADGCG